MANRYAQNITFSFQRSVWHAYAQITFGASGAPTLAQNPAISTVVRNSAGNYTINFKDQYNALLMVKHVFNSGTSAPAAPGMYIKTNTTSTTPSSMNIIFNLSGTAGDPASGEIVYLDFVFNNSSLKI